jgi:peptidoglycan/xylan/chitin deacetylase (PgdA/CDA1 family)
MANTSFPWPDGRQGAISLTFDDGMRSQYEVAVPILNEHGLCGTFYLQPRDDYEERLAPWRQVLASGHELGNHSVHHYGSVNISLSPVGLKGGVEELTLADMEYEITEAARRLRSLFPEQREMSFAYPCYQSTVGSAV